MNNIDELQNYLEIDHHPDTWAEYSSSYARDLAECLTEEEWEKLKLIWTQQGIAWQTRLIDVIYSISSDNKFDVLESMVLCAEEPVRDAAIEALELNTPGYTPPVRIVEKLADIRKNGTDIFLNERIRNILQYKEDNNVSD